MNRADARWMLQFLGILLGFVIVVGGVMGFTEAYPMVMLGILAAVGVGMFLYLVYCAFIKKEQKS
jgi:zinc transporter ZupT